jgi:hypothetical protein
MKLTKLISEISSIAGGKPPTHTPELIDFLNNNKSFFIHKIIQQNGWLNERGGWPEVVQE